MKDKKKMRLKKFYFHPITIFVFLTIFVMIFSSILSAFQAQATYNVVNVNTKELEPTLIAVENLLSFNEIQFMISNASKNFLSFGPLGMILLALIGITIAEGTGFIETFTRRHLSKMTDGGMTFLVIFLATVSSIVNEVGYAILIPLAALIYFISKRNPILGIVTAFCGVSFGYGVSIFAGSMEVDLIQYTQQVALLIDENVHIALSSNLIFIIVTSFVLSIVGTLIIEKIIAPKLGTYKKEEVFSKTEEYKVINLVDEEQREKERDKYEKRGLRMALITSIIILLIFIYSIIPGLPFSGLLLDAKESTYANQLFGSNSYFQEGFSYLVCLLFSIAGIAYGIGSKSIKNDKDIIENASKKFGNMGSVIILIFVVAQFISVFRRSNIGMVLTTWLAELLGTLNLSGIPLVLVALLFVAISNLVLTSPTSKWMILSPIIVPMCMQANISPEFAQIIMRAGDSMTKGFTPMLASFVIYIGFLNMYNLEKNKPYTIRKSLQLIWPYFAIIAITWILLVVIWYLIGIPIGPGVFPTI